MNYSFAFTDNLKSTVSHLLTAIPLWACEKAKPVNIGSLNGRIKIPNPGCDLIPNH